METKAANFALPMQRGESRTYCPRSLRTAVWRVHSIVLYATPDQHAPSSNYTFTLKTIL